MKLDLNKVWNDTTIMNLLDVVEDPRIISLSTRSSLKRTLEQIIDQLNRCQKALNQFLEVCITIRKIIQINLIENIHLYHRSYN